MKDFEIGLHSAENLAWAPNVEGLHKTPVLKAVVKDLWKAIEAGGTFTEIRTRMVNVLREHGEIATGWGQ